MQLYFNAEQLSTMWPTYMFGTYSAIFENTRGELRMNSKEFVMSEIVNNIHIISHLSYDRCNDESE